MNVHSFVPRTIEGLAYTFPESVIHPPHLKITLTNQINLFALVQSKLSFS